MMKSTPLLTAALIALAAAGAAEAQGKAQGDCPPGLAKKAPPCVPPGQARKQAAARAHPGQALPPGASAVRDYGLYGLRPPAAGEAWYVADGSVYRVDRTTRTILQVLSLASLLGN